MHGASLTLPTDTPVSRPLAPARLHFTHTLHTDASRARTSGRLVVTGRHLSIPPFLLSLLPSDSNVSMDAHLYGSVSDHIKGTRPSVCCG